MVVRHDEFPHPADPAKIRAMTEFAIDRLGYPYNAAEIAKIGLRIAAGLAHVTLPGELQPTTSFICSEYVAGCSLRWELRFGRIWRATWRPPTLRPTRIFRRSYRSARIPRLASGDRWAGGTPERHINVRFGSQSAISDLGRESGPSLVQSPKKIPVPELASNAHARLVGPRSVRWHRRGLSPSSIIVRESAFRGLRCPTIDPLCSPELS